tara:strand:- start:2452 stop:2736 length:285 start_codon:yes stop_codon:yes gene_type:complete
MTDDPYAPGGIYYVNPEVPEECREEISLKELNVRSGKEAYTFCLSLAKTTCRRLDWDVSTAQQEIKDAALPNVSKKKIVAKFNEIFSPWVTLIK